MTLHDDVAEALKRLRANDPSARDDLIHLHMGLTMSLAHKFANRTPWLRDEIISTALETLTLKVSTCPHDNIGGYISKSITGELRKLVARQRPIPIHGEDLVPEQATANILLEELVSLVKDKEKNVIRLLAEGYTVEEIGEKLGVTRQRANIVVREIRKKLRKHVY